MGRIAPNLESTGKRMRAVREVHDLDARFRAMDPFGDHRQIVSLPNPPTEDITTPAQGVEPARVGNDSMAELVERHRDRFPDFVAALAMHSMDETMEELYRGCECLVKIPQSRVFESVEGWYNPRRRHPAIAYMPPVAYEQAAGGGAPRCRNARQSTKPWQLQCSTESSTAKTESGASRSFLRFCGRPSARCSPWTT